MINHEHAKQALKDSLFIIDRDNQIKRFVKVIKDAYQLKKKKCILVKGCTGSGKSLFLRCSFVELIKQDNNFQESTFNTDTKRIFFCTNQTPITIKKPFNGFYKIFREIYQYLYLYFDEKINIKACNFNKCNLENISNEDKDSNKNSLRCINVKRFNEEIINIIIEEKCFYLIKYLEMILKKDLMNIRFCQRVNFLKSTFCEQCSLRVSFINQTLSVSE